MQKSWKLRHRLTRTQGLEKSVSQRIEVKLKTFRTLLLYSRIPDNGEEFSIPKNNILYILISCLSEMMSNVMPHCLFAQFIIILMG